MFFSALLILVGFGSFGSVSGSPAVDEAYRAVVSLVSPGQQHLTGDSLRSLFNTLEKRVQCGGVSCEKCNLTDAVHQLISNHSIHEEHEDEKAEENITIGVSQFPALAAGCVLYLTSPGLVCNATRHGRWAEEIEHFLHEITHEEHEEHEEHEAHEEHHEHRNEDSEPHHEHEHIDVDRLMVLFGELRDHYEPLKNENCITASDIMTEANASSPGQTQEVGAVLGRILYHALQGRCFLNRALPEESFFVNYILNRLGSENFTVADLETLMRILNLGPDMEATHEHEHEEEHGHEEEHEHEHHEDEHADHDHSGSRRRKKSNHEHHEGHEKNTTWDKFCFSAEELVWIYGLADNGSASSGLGSSGLTRLSPALVQQILSGACADIPQPPRPDGLTTAERYIYATIANVVITLTSMFGIVILLCTSCTSVFQLCIQFCISLAVGSLTGDALLHLLPMFLGLHVHSDETSSKHSHDSHNEETPDYIYKMLVVISGIYYFYLMETIFSLITYKENHHHHQHHHAEEAEPHHCDHGRVLEMYQQERKQKDKSQSASKAELFQVDFEDAEPKERTREQRLLPYMITIGDGIHNFADGLAMGAAFSLSWKSGLATSLAVLCHELPHELGDFAILLHSGVSVRRALLLNVGSAMTSFVGLYIALSVATDLATKQWIAAITAGLFLYVGLADMLPTMVHISNKRPWLMFLLQNIGLLTGWGILLVLSLYEERISF
ncbi:Zinc transporter ZIP4 Solute carrier family 39 member 4 Zrt- and Irt-like protein 4 [Larimichthys crocea]|uniref:Zinc transporter ZIP4 n=1 Tax=Larimichthys crocea TaxID=215358 RepID=A0A6G0HSA8_LARCR|nr:Zinc transporter ZIP4 Solute carrier family 39 member 4 Zrt- and Irt-like protein 4 [Larimichthys crocea]